MAKGELFLCCDSDDYLTENCLEIANRVEGSIKNEDRKKYAGICGLRGGADLSIIGTSFTGTDYLDITFFEREKYGITGDKAEILYTEIWRQYLFPEISGENFLTEYVGLSKIAEEGLLVRYFNEVVRITEYLEDGLTCNSVNKFIQNPKGWGLYIGQLIRQGTLRGKKRFRKELEYYNCCKNTIGLFEMADNIGVPRVVFVFNIILSYMGKTAKKSIRVMKGGKMCIIEILTWFHC